MVKRWFHIKDIRNLKMGITEELLEMSIAFLWIQSSVYVDEPLASCMMVHFWVYVSKWHLLCKFGVSQRIFVLIFAVFMFSYLTSFVCHFSSQMTLLWNSFFVPCTVLPKMKSLLFLVLKYRYTEIKMEWLRFVKVETQEHWNGITKN